MTQSARERLVGVWDLRSIRDRQADGSERDAPDFGPGPAGRLVYTASGNVSVNFMRRFRVPWNRENEPEDFERANAAAGYGAYAGRFTVQEVEGLVIHHVEVALIPNRVGKDLGRHFSFDCERLILRPPTLYRSARPIERALTWERMG